MAKTEVDVIIKGQDKASGVMGKIGKLAKGLGKGLAGIGVAAVGMGLASVKSFADAGDEVQKMALKTGFSTEALSELKHAANLSGTSIQGLEKGFKKMSSVVLDAQQGLSTGTDALAMMGMTVEDLAGLDPEQTFLKMSEAIADIEDPIIKAAAAQDVFGKAGVDLLPMLANGAEGLKEMREEANDLGLVFSQEAADDAADFKDSLTKLQGAFSGLMKEIGQALMPVLDALIPVLIDLVKSLPLDEIAKLVKTLLPPLVLLFTDLLAAIPLVKFVELISKVMKPLMVILTAVMSIASPLLRLLEPILDILMLILDVLTPIIEAITWITREAGKLLDKGIGKVVGWVGGLLGGNKGEVGMQKGGIVTGPTRALIGEAGPEAVIPLRGGGIGDVFNITVEGSVWSLDDLTDRLRVEFLKIKTDNTTTGF